MKIDGSKNIICLISSYKFTSNKISKIIIDMEDSPKEFIIKFGDMKSYCHELFQCYKLVSGL